MEPLTWTGALGAMINPVALVLALAFAVAVLVQITLSILMPSGRDVINADGTIAQGRDPYSISAAATKFLFLGLVVIALTYIFGGMLMGAPAAGIIGGMSRQLMPVWAALILLFGLSMAFKRKLGLYGKLFDSTVGMVGFGLVMFWVFTGLFGAMDLIVTHDTLKQFSGMKNKVPGTSLRGAEDGDYAWFLLGGDNLARDVFSRIVKGSWIVIQIAPLATLFAFMVGITLGLPAAYSTGPAVPRDGWGFKTLLTIAGLLALAGFLFGGLVNGIITAVLLAILVLALLRSSLDTALSFLANLILAFPVILLFYLLVTPEIVIAGIPNYMALVLFIFPLVFFGVLLNSRYHTQPAVRTPLLVIVLGGLGWLYLSLVSTDGYFIKTPGYSVWGLPRWLDGFDIDPGILVVFVSVVFVNSPTVFRIVRGLALDIKTRDYVAAAQTRGEGPWYIMLWEILPNARGPLIVDFCLRIGYTTILLGTLGFFGLGLQSESPDWGTTINAGRKLLSVYPHAALAPAIALLTLVLGLNLLADGLREESLKD